jgi:hypothetical protein
LTELRLTGRAGDHSRPLSRSTHGHSHGHGHGHSHDHTMRWRGWREEGYVSGRYVYGGARGRWDGTAEACGELGALLSVSPCLEVLVASKYFTLDAKTSRWRTSNFHYSLICLFRGVNRFVKTSLESGGGARRGRRVIILRTILFSVF